MPSTVALQKQTSLHYAEQSAKKPSLSQIFSETDNSHRKFKKTACPDTEFLTTLIAIIAPAVIGAITSYAVVKTEQELGKLLNYEGNIPKVNGILKKKKEGEFLVNHPDSEHFCEVPIKPKGPVATNYNAYNRYYVELEKFIKVINLWVDEHPYIRDRDLLRELGGKNKYTSDDLIKVQKVASTSNSREIWALKAIIHAKLEQIQNAKETIDALANMPLERAITNKENRIFSCIAKTLCNQAYLNPCGESNSGLLDIFTFKLTAALKDNSVQETHKLGIDRIFQTQLETNKHFASIILALCENINWLQISGKDSKFKSLADLKDQSPFTKQEKLCLGHIDKVAEATSREEVRTLCKKIITQCNYDKSLQKPCEVFHSRRPVRREIYNLFLRKKHYKDSRDCDDFSYETSIDLVRSLEIADRDTLLKILDELFQIPLNEIDFKDHSLECRYVSNLIKIALSLACLELEETYDLESAERVLDTLRKSPFDSDISLKELGCSEVSLEPQYYHLELEELKDKKILLIDGLHSHLNDSQEFAYDLSELIEDANIHVIHNPAQGSFRGVASSDEDEIIFLEAQETITAQIYELFLDEPTESVCIVCHNRATQSVEEALLNLPSTLRDKIELIVMAPSHLLQEGCCKKVTYLVNNRDLRAHLSIEDSLSKNPDLKKNFVFFNPQIETTPSSLNIDSKDYQKGLSLQLMNFIDQNQELQDTEVIA